MEFGIPVFKFVDYSRGTFWKIFVCCCFLFSVIFVIHDVQNSIITYFLHPPPETLLNICQSVWLVEYRGSLLVSPMLNDKVPLFLKIHHNESENTQVLILAVADGWLLRFSWFCAPYYVPDIKAKERCSMNVNWLFLYNFMNRYLIRTIFFIIILLRDDIHLFFSPRKSLIFCVNGTSPFSLTFF